MSTERDEFTGYDDKANEILERFRQKGYVNEGEIKEMALISIELLIEEWDNEGGREAKQNYWRVIKCKVEAK